MYKENCKGNPLIVMVTAFPTMDHTKCRTKHVVLQSCNGACLINHIKKKTVLTRHSAVHCCTPDYRQTTSNYEQVERCRFDPAAAVGDLAVGHAHTGGCGLGERQRGETGLTSLRHWEY